MNGDFHFVAYTLAAFHHLHFPPFTKWIVDKTGYEKSIKKDDDNITHFKHYDHFYQLITLAILTVLTESLDPAVMSMPKVLIEQCKANKGRH